MFDFLNYTYSGVLSILSALFGLSYPLILGCVEKIEVKYHSTKLTARFLEEKAFKGFKVLLILNLVLAVVFPFMMDGCQHSRYLIAIQCLAAVVLIYFAFRLFNQILTYYDVGKLQARILDDYDAAAKAGKTEKEAEYFTQWSDLTSVLLASADENLVQSVYERWYDYVSKKLISCKGKPLELDDYFYDAVTRINENLCKGERKPISVNNGNSLLTSLILYKSIVTDKTYRILWRNLRLQLYYNRDEWIMAYWKSASQKFEFFMNEISEYEIDEETNEHYTEEQVEDRHKQRIKFEEFHVMLCAMLLQQGKYGLLEQMLFYTQSQPPKYPLVPSDLAHILHLFGYLNEDRLWEVTYYEERYPMPNMHGITGGKIIGAANSYLALLFYRLYVIDYPYGRDFVFRTMGLPDNQAKLAKYKRDLDVLKYWIERINNNKEALASIRINDMDEILDPANNPENEVIQSPEQIIKGIQSSIDDKIKYLKQHQQNNPDKIKKLENEVSGRLLMAMSPFGDIWGKRFDRNTCYNLDSSISQLYPSTAFQDNPDVSHVGIEECVFGSMWHTFSHLFASSFFQERMQADYTIDSGLLFDAFDKLQVNGRHYAIAFGISLDYYMDRVGELKKEQDRIYSYRGMKIMLLDCPSQYFSRRIYITLKEDRPYIGFQEPSEEQKVSMELDKFNEYGLWMSVQKVEGHEDTITEEYLKKLGNEKNMYSVFHALWAPKLFFKEQYDMICLKVHYKTTDEGKTDDVETIKPFKEHKTDE